MSDTAEAVQSDSQQVSDAPATETTKTESSPAAQKDSGYVPPVDLSGLPDDIRAPIEGRLAHMSRLMKKNENKYSSQISEWRDVAAQQAKVIEELQTGVGAVVDHLHDKSFNDAEDKITQRMEAAHEAGDTKGFLAAQKDLLRLEAKKLQIEDRKKSTPAKTEKQTVARSAGEMANEAVTDGEISSEDGYAVRVWQDEKDQNGNLVRPWAHSKTPDKPTNDPYYRRALIESAAVFDDASPWADKSVAEKLAEVDRRMGVSKPNAGQSVMGGSLTNIRQNKKITLTPDQERLAIRTKFGGSKAKSDADHLAAYRAQVEKVNSNKGTRK